jgi:hypothetical protein
VVIEEEIAPIAKRVARMMNSPVIDVKSVTQEHPEYFPEGVHPNDVRVKVIAREMHSVLTSKGWFAR